LLGSDKKENAYRYALAFRNTKLVPFPKIEIIHSVAGKMPKPT